MECKQFVESIIYNLNKFIVIRQRIEITQRFGWVFVCEIDYIELSYIGH